MRVRELADLTRGLDVARFEKQMGPFALMQRPASEERVQQGRASRAGMTMPMPSPASLLAAPVEFEELVVATLPPVLANGLMRLVIGRSPDCDVVVDDPSVSSRHAVIHWNGTAGVIIELGSSNGTFVNGKQVVGDATLQSGDHLSFGPSHFIYLLAPALHERLKKAGTRTSHGSPL